MLKQPKHKTDQSIIHHYHQQGHTDFERIIASIAKLNSCYIRRGVGSQVDSPNHSIYFSNNPILRLYRHHSNDLVLYSHIENLSLSYSPSSLFFLLSGPAYTGPTGERIDPAATKRKAAADDEE